MHSIAIILSFLLVFLCLESEARQKSVRISLDAKWKSTPILLETSEFMADEALFREFVDELKTQKVLNDIETNEGLYQHILKVASRLMSEARIKLLKFSLSIRLYSPKVILHQQDVGGKFKTDCSAFAVIGSSIVCDSSLVDSVFAGLSADVSFASLYADDFRRCLTSCDKDRSRPIIIYGELGTPELNKFLLQNYAGYTVLRHYVKEEYNNKVRLSGYGVELAIKSTEYKAQDDSKKEESADVLDGEVGGYNFTRLGQRFPDLHKQLSSFKNVLSASTNELKPLKAWQMQDLSYQACQKAVSSSADSPVKQLEVLRDASQDFPSLAYTIAQTTVSPELRSAVKSTQQLLEQYGVAAGDSAFYINGIALEVDTVDMFSLYDTVKEDLKVMDTLSGIGLANDDVGSLLKQISGSKEQQYALDIRDSSIRYINDLENDAAYRRWPKTLTALLQPTFPGMMRHLSRNLFNLVYMFNASDASAIETLEFLVTLYQHSAPIRIGLLPVAVESDVVGSSIAQAFHSLVEDSDGIAALTKLIELYRSVKSSDVISIEAVKTFFKSINLDQIVEDEDFINARQKSYRFYERSGLKTLPSLLLNGVVLRSINPGNIEEVVVSEVLQATPTFQKAVYYGKLTDEMDPLEWLMMQDHVMPRLNSRVLSTEKTCVNMGKLSGLDIQNMAFLSKGGREEETIHETTMMVVCDLNTEAGRGLLTNAFAHMRNSAKVRLGVIHNPSKMESAGNVNRLVQVALETLSNNMARSFISKVLSSGKGFIGEEDLGGLAVPGMDIEMFKKNLKVSESHLAAHREFIRMKLSLSPGDAAVISNGLLIGPFDDDELFTSDDFSLLEEVGNSNVVSKVVKSVKKLNLDPKKSSDVVSLALSTLGCLKSDKSRKDIVLGNSENSLGVIRISPELSQPAFDITVIIDPLTRAAQKVLPIILTLRKVVNCDVKVYLNPREKLSEMPLKSFYKYVLEPELSFNVIGELASGPEAVFDTLPHKSILTLNLLAPEGWLVEAVSAVHDLDNIKLEQTKNGVEAVFELEHLLVEGHCYETDNGQPPRGLQFILGTEKTPESATVDTIVMANLGYFQLKASPGVWHLMIRPGRSADLYTISSHQQTDSSADSDDVIVVMDTFKSKIISLKVKKRPGMEGQELLSDGADEDDSYGLWGSISSQFIGKKATAGEDEKDEYLNIFSLASGHLYERLMRIMILSIIKQTKQPVKFWLLKNYLSPGFKKFIPVMAEKYGFKFELVQYKWPRWLNQQTEKQRVMWAYKILFLDVLFPLDVKKIAFIDADQIVRTDIKELFDVDLEGAPYGYTPFCDSRKEMDGFRFWRSGYWASHLAGRPYHISALYVIDLKRFRRIAAGDRLRGQYQALSQDPNSLSNLDQDLPNNMIHQVRIKSLPQDWLWCETWCNDQSKKTAKTIDLCNNPLTKEPKLDAARRIVPEWTSYDDEIREQYERWLSTGSIEPSGSPTTADSAKHIEL